MAIPRNHFPDSVQTLETRTRSEMIGSKKLEPIFSDENPLSTTEDYQAVYQANSEKVLEVLVLEKTLVLGKTPVSAKIPVSVKILASVKSQMSAKKKQEITPE